MKATKPGLLFGAMAAAVAATLLTSSILVHAAPKKEAMSKIPPAITTPDRVETRIGTLEYRDGAPTPATIEKVKNDLLYVRGVDAFMNSFSGASAYAIREGFHSIGAEDNSVVIFSDLMDSNSKGIPAAKFWSFTVYDNQTRSMLQTPQRYPRAGSQTYPSPAAVADADGSTTIYFGPTKPANAKRGNWIQTVPGKGWFLLLRLYSPEESFFTKEWRPSEIELVK